MSNFKGTKGKWSYSPCTWKVFSLDENGEADKAICDLLPIIDKTNKKANALIISKAPEMLEMLGDILEQIEDGRTYITKEEIKKLIKEATEL